MAAAQSEQSAAGAPSGQRRWGLAIALAALTAIVVWTLVAWNRASALGEEKLSALISRQSAAVAQEADAIRFNVARSLAYLHGIPTAIADQAAVTEALASFGPEIERSGLPQNVRAEGWLARADLDALNRHLALVSDELGSDVIFVMNASGDCIAASNYGTKTSLVGGHFSDREYFQQPRSGSRGRQYAMGRITNIPGLFFSAPVMSQGR